MIIHDMKLDESALKDYLLTINIKPHKLLYLIDVFITVHTVTFDKLVMIEVYNISYLILIILYLIFHASSKIRK